MSAFRYEQKAAKAIVKTRSSPQCRLSSQSMGSVKYFTHIAQLPLIHLGFYCNISMDWIQYTIYKI